MPRRARRNSSARYQGSLAQGQSCRFISGVSPVRSREERLFRARSSEEERLPYKQRVGGSIPSGHTMRSWRNWYSRQLEVLVGASP